MRQKQSKQLFKLYSLCNINDTRYYNTNKNDILLYWLYNTNTIAIDGWGQFNALVGMLCYIVYWKFYFGQSIIKLLVAEEFLKSSTINYNKNIANLSKRA